MPAKRVVITGGSKGFGLALARECLRAGDSVVMCGRTGTRVSAALAALSAEFGGDRVHGMTADCSVPRDVAAVADLAEERMGGIDLWINNAGEVTSKKLLADVDPDEIVRVVGTNVLGSLLGSREAIRVMRRQPPSKQPIYHVFNCGFSAWGAKFTKSAATHKSTKRALTQLCESLAAELAESGVTSIGVHNLSPGMMLTGLLLKDSTPAARRFFNALAEEPETVAAALAQRIRGVQGSGGSVDYLTPADAAFRVLSSVPQINNGGRFFDKEGNRVQRPGEEYSPDGVRLQVPM